MKDLLLFYAHRIFVRVVEIVGAFNICTCVICEHPSMIKDLSVIWWVVAYLWSISVIQLIDFNGNRFRLPKEDNQKHLPKEKKLRRHITPEVVICISYLLIRMISSPICIRNDLFGSVYISAIIRLSIILVISAIEYFSIVDPILSLFRIGRYIVWPRLEPNHNRLRTIGKILWDEYRIFSQLTPGILDMIQGRATCRICYEDRDYIHLLKPCQCTGSIKFVHDECLNTWLQTCCNPREICASCQAPYHELVLEKKSL